MPQPAENIIQFPAQKKKKGTHTSGLIARHFRYTDPITGAAKRKSIYGKTTAEAEKKKRSFLAKVEQGLRVNEQGKTVGMWADEWLAYKKNTGIGASTIEGYENDIRIIKEALEYRPLSSILPIDLKILMASRAGMSTSSLSKTAMTIRSIFRAAVENRLIVFDPSANLKAPSGTRGTHRAITLEEQAIVEKVAQTHRLGYAVMLMLWAGLRRGEACAFDNTCVHGDELRITRSLEWINNKPYIKEPKTEAGIRAIPIWPQLLPFLYRPGYAAQPAKGGGLITEHGFVRAFESFVYCCEVELNGCHRRWLKEGQEWQTFPLRSHDLRHTWFTMLYDANVDVKVAADWGGHSDISVTQRTYQHIRQERKRMEAKKAIQNTGGGKNGGNRKIYRLNRYMHQGKTDLAHS